MKKLRNDAKISRDKEIALGGQPLVSAGNKMQEEKIMSVLYVSNEEYAPILGVSLRSLLETHRSIPRLNVYIISDGITEESRERLNHIADRDGRKLIYLSKPDMTAVLGRIPSLGKWGCDNIFCRLFIPACFQKNCEDLPDRILYLDCDTVVCRDLSGLWALDMQDNCCAAGMECMGNWHKRLIRLAPEDPYYNSGVILVDTRNWQRFNMEAKCREFAGKHARRLEYPDESVFNGAVKGKILTLPPEYNLTTVKCAFTYDELRLYRKSQVMYTPEEYTNALMNPAVIHFTSSYLIRRPWYKGEDRDAHVFEAWFRGYYKTTEWKSESYKEEKLGWFKRYARTFTQRHKRLGAKHFGNIYSYIKPLKKLFF